MDKRARTQEYGCHWKVILFIPGCKWQRVNRLNASGVNIQLFHIIVLKKQLLHRIMWGENPSEEPISASPPCTQHSHTYRAGVRGPVSESMFQPTLLSGVGKITQQLKNGEEDQQPGQIPYQLHISLSYADVCLYIQTVSVQTHTASDHACTVGTDILGRGQVVSLSSARKLFSF